MKEPTGKVRTKILPVLRMCRPAKRILKKNMEGPISSLMHETGEAFDTEETKNQAEEEKEKKM